MAAEAISHVDTLEEIKELQVNSPEAFDALKKDITEEIATAGSDAQFTDKEIKEIADINDDGEHTTYEEQIKVRAKEHLKTLHDIETQVDFLLGLVEIAVGNNSEQKGLKDFAKAAAENTKDTAANLVVDNIDLTDVLEDTPQSFTEEFLEGNQDFSSLDSNKKQEVLGSLGEDDIRKIKNKELFDLFLDKIASIGEDQQNYLLKEYHYDMKAHGTLDLYVENFNLHPQLQELLASRKVGKDLDDILNNQKSFEDLNQEEKNALFVNLVNRDPRIFKGITDVNIVKGALEYMDRNKSQYSKVDYEHKRSVILKAIINNPNVDLLQLREVSGLQEKYAEMKKEKVQETEDHITEMRNLEQEKVKELTEKENKYFLKHPEDVYLIQDEDKLQDILETFKVNNKTISIDNINPYTIIKDSLTPSLFGNYLIKEEVITMDTIPASFIVALGPIPGVLEGKFLEKIGDKLVQSIASEPEAKQVDELTKALCIGIEYSDLEDAIGTDSGLLSALKTAASNELATKTNKTLDECKELLHLDIRNIKYFPEEHINNKAFLQECLETITKQTTDQKLIEELTANLPINNINRALQMVKFFTESHMGLTYQSILSNKRLAGFTYLMEEKDNVVEREYWNTFEELQYFQTQSGEIQGHFSQFEGSYKDISFSSETTLQHIKDKLSTYSSLDIEKKETLTAIIKNSPLFKETGNRITKDNYRNLIIDIFEFSREKSITSEQREEILNMIHDVLKSKNETKKSDAEKKLKDLGFGMSGEEFLATFKTKSIDDLQKDLQGKVSNIELKKKQDEDDVSYKKRLIELYIKNQGFEDQDINEALLELLSSVSEGIIIDENGKNIQKIARSETLEDVQTHFAAINKSILIRQADSVLTTSELTEYVEQNNLQSVYQEYLEGKKQSDESEKKNTTNTSSGEQSSFEAQSFTASLPEGYSFSTESNTLVTPSGEQIPISSEEKQLITDPEGLNNLINFHNLFVSLNLESVWKYRAELVKAMGINNVKLDGDSLSKEELVPFGNKLFTMINNLPQEEGEPPRKRFSTSHSNFSSMVAELREFSQSGFSKGKDFNNLGEDRFAASLRDFGVLSETYGIKIGIARDLMQNN